MERETTTSPVVEDQKINREILCSILRPEYAVLEAGNGAGTLDLGAWDFVTKPCRPQTLLGCLKT